MNINKIFDLFDGKSDFKDEEIQVINLYEQPLFWVGMFEKLIKNNDIFKHQLSTFFKKNDPEYSTELLEESGDAVVFNRAWQFIKQIDLTNPNHQNAVRIRANKGYLFKALEKAINYFVELEDYEKCSHLKNIFDFGKESLEA
jgi:hypothetical protein